MCAHEHMHDAYDSAETGKGFFLRVPRKQPTTIEPKTQERPGLRRDVSGCCQCACAHAAAPIVLCRPGLFKPDVNLLLQYSNIIYTTYTHKAFKKIHRGNLHTQIFQRIMSHRCHNLLNHRTPRLGPTSPSTPVHALRTRWKKRHVAPHKLVSCVVSPVSHKRSCPCIPANLKTARLSDGSAADRVNTYVTYYIRSLPIYNKTNVHVCHP